MLLIDEKEENNQIHGLFPTPVLKTSLKRDFTEDEKKFFRDGANQVIHNTGNHFTQNTDVLNESIFYDIHRIILRKLGDYVYNVYKPKNKIKVQVTQSWINYTNVNEFHHQHSHPNSFLSGVLYLQTESERDQIIFHRDGYRLIRINETNNDDLNAESWFFKVETGDLVIFPSHLQHNVNQIKDEEEKGKTRISLAFNTFIKGDLGSKEGLTKLII